MVDYVRETTPCQISFKCLHEGWGLTLRYILDYDKDDNGDTDEDNCACAVVEKVLRHYMCHHPRRYTRSNHWSCHRVVIATVSAPAVLLRCCRHEGGTAICWCVPYIPTVGQVFCGGFGLAVLSCLLVFSSQYHIFLSCLCSSFFIIRLDCSVNWLMRKGIARLQFKKRQNRHSRRQRHREGWDVGRGVGRGAPSLPEEGSGEGTKPLRENFLLGLFDLKLEHFDAVFKLDLTEETRT